MALVLGAGLAAPGSARAVSLYSTPGSMQDLDIGADGDVFATGTDGAVYQWIKGGWAPFGGRGERIAVDPAGHPWLINSSHQIWFHDGASWSQKPGTARAIDVGADGSVFMISYSSGANGYVYRWTGSGWSYFGGYGQEITVDKDGRPWVINSSRQVYRWDGARYNYISGEARDIDAGAEGTVYMLGGGHYADGYVYRWAGSGWTYNGGYGTRITVAPTGAPSLINSAHSVWGNFVRRLHGDTTCGPNERDCNVCAYDVRRQFDRLFSGYRDDSNDTWRVQWNQRYWPDLMLPTDAFDDNDQISSHHVQGFARTGSPNYPFVGSYSDDAHASTFVIITDGSGNESLQWLHQAIGNEKHGSGVHALGHYYGVVERAGGPGGNADQLRINDVDQPFIADILYTPPSAYPISTAGGGLGLARLGHEKYLVVSTNEGGGGNAARSSKIYQLDGRINTATMTHLGTNYHQRRPEWGDNYRTSENVSLITECETGQIYAVHVSGEPLDGGSGHWRLDRLEQGPNGPVMRGISVYTDWQNINRCFLRAAGTAYAGDDHIIDLYCHEYDASHELWESSEGVDFVRREGRPLPSLFVIFPWFGL